LTPIINIDPDPDVADAPAVVVENVTEPTDVAIADKPVDIADTLNTNRNSTGPTDAAPNPVLADDSDVAGAPNPSISGVVTDPTDAAPTPVSVTDAPTVLVEPVFPIVVGAGEQNEAEALLGAPRGAGCLSCGGSGYCWRNNRGIHEWIMWMRRRAHISDG